MGSTGTNTPVFHLRPHWSERPAANHPAFYYGIVGAGLAWQIAFLIIAKYPARLRYVMIPAVLEKFSYGIAMLVLYSQARVHGSDMVFAGVDLLLGVLFIVAFLITRDESAADR